ncbi:hypothetical protein Ciccas_000608 [Cichlidogyrus casuarinus]|uniref:Uncharacterized protein n=1 Tax=Cichlidogyrus casuarinus TaxID=1844966 RepID=A0ABD2QQD7_9PLAT
MESTEEPMMQNEEEENSGALELPNEPAEELEQFKICRNELIEYVKKFQRQHRFGKPLWLRLRKNLRYERDEKAVERLLVETQEIMNDFGHRNKGLFLAFIKLNVFQSVLFLMVNCELVHKNQKHEIQQLEDTLCDLFKLDLQNKDGTLRQKIMQEVESLVEPTELNLTLKKRFREIDEEFKTGYKSGLICNGGECPYPATIESVFQQLKDHELPIDYVEEGVPENAENYNYEYSSTYQEEYFATKQQ